MMLPDKSDFNCSQQQNLCCLQIHLTSHIVLSLDHWLLTLSASGLLGCLSTVIRNRASATRGVQPMHLHRVVGLGRQQISKDGFLNTRFFL